MTMQNLERAIEEAAARGVIELPHQPSWITDEVRKVAILEADNGIAEFWFGRPHFVDGAVPLFASFMNRLFMLGYYRFAEDGE